MAELAYYLIQFTGTICTNGINAVLEELGSAQVLVITPAAASQQGGQARNPCFRVQLCQARKPLPLMGIWELWEERHHPTLQASETTVPATS
uniref:Uncharacterized protein n=1 Tax=Arundo donax TaxID=35708 RepID=A0A0A8YC08_ARUDO